MIGWHYTTASAYKSIKAFGMRPVPCVRSELANYNLPVNFNGIWVWAQPLSQRSELGILLYVLSQHSEVDLVRLRIEYNSEDRLGVSRNDSLKQYITFYNAQTFEKYKLIDDNPASHVITEAIRPKNVTLEKRFNLLELVNGNNQEAESRATKSLRR